MSYVDDSYAWSCHDRKKEAVAELRRRWEETRAKHYDWSWDDYVWEVFRHAVDAPPSRGAGT